MDGLPPSLLQYAPVRRKGNPSSGISAALPVLLLEGYGGQRPADDRGAPPSPSPGEISGKSKHPPQPEKPTPKTQQPKKTTPKPQPQHTKKKKNKKKQKKKQQQQTKKKKKKKKKKTPPYPLVPSRLSFFIPKPAVDLPCEKCPGQWTYPLTGALAGFAACYLPLCRNFIYNKDWVWSAE